MNEPTNAPMLPPRSGLSAWVADWRDAITRPNEQTFARIARSPHAKLSTALLWVFVGGLLNYILSLPAQAATMRQLMQNPQFGGQVFPEAAGGGLAAAVCGAPVWAVVQVVFFVIIAGVVQLLARMFGGRGTFEQLAYALACVVTPFYLVSGLLGLLSAIPYAGACFGILGFVAALYILVLEVMAVKGVNQFGWGQAIGSLLLPVIAIACCVSIGVASIFSMIAPQLGEIFNSIATPPVP